MGLLDKIEKKIQKHPLAKEDYEAKVYYLNAIAYFISVDDVISDAEKTSFNSIIELLNCDNVKDDLYDFFENPDIDDFENIFQYIKDKDYFLHYILDIFYLLEDNKLNENEERFLNIILDLLDYKEDDILLLLSFCNAVKEENSKSIEDIFAEIYRNDFFLENIDSIQKFYKFTNSLQRKLSKMILENEIPSLEKELNDYLKPYIELQQILIYENLISLRCTDIEKDIEKEKIKNKIKTLNNKDKVIKILLDNLLV